MGSSLSPFLANLFMSYFETTLKREREIFHMSIHVIRYVEDVHAIIKKYQLRSLLKRLNDQKYPYKKNKREN